MTNKKPSNRLINSKNHQFTFLNRYIQVNLFIVLLGICASQVARADEDSIKINTQINTETIEVLSKRLNLIGIADSASQGIVPAERIINVPLLRPGEALEQVPGLIVTQHSGSGKGNQYFLRGFNLDHGTDFSISLEGTPVNMPSHGHGQGYADINFLIPELIESVDFRKGPYFAELGDFSAAGATRINYYHNLPQNIASATLGENGYQRLLFAGSTALGSGNLLVGLEGLHDDGPFINAENFQKLNGVLRWGTGNDEHGFDVLGIFYHSRGDATNQIAQRSVASGLIDRFGTLDDSDASLTHRYSVSADWRDGPTKANAYFIDYKLNLFSNFTYFLDDPINGDQFEQEDERRVYGGSITHSWHSHFAGLKLDQSAGIQARYDDIDSVALFNTLKRQRLSTTRQDAVEQISTGIWWQGAWQTTKQLRTTFGLRADYYDFEVNSDKALNSGSANDAIVSPKLSLAYLVNPDTELYLSLGRGFHSNDARGTTITQDPKTAEPVNKVDPLVHAKGGEIGLRASWLPNWETTLALFQLNLDSELLFIGDAGNTEASRPSKRVGVEWTNHYRPTDWLFIDADIALSRAKFRDSDAAGKHIPGSINKTASFSVTAGHEFGWYGSARFRYFGPRSLIEDNSQRSNSTFITNARAGYRINKRLNVAIDVLNVFDSNNHDIDYFYASRLQGEPAEGVEDFHYHPVIPRTFRLSVQYTY